MKNKNIVKSIKMIKFFQALKMKSINISDKN